MVVGARILLALILEKNVTVQYLQMIEQSKIFKLSYYNEYKSYLRCDNVAAVTSV